MLSLYTGWVKNVKEYASEIAQGSTSFEGFPKKAWIFFIKWICPIVILLVLLNMIGIFGTPGEGG